MVLDNLLEITATAISERIRKHSNTMMHWIIFCIIMISNKSGGTGENKEEGADRDSNRSDIEATMTTESHFERVVPPVKHDTSKSTNPDNERTSHDFLEMSEFVYGQRAVYGEVCDLQLYVDIVRRPIFLAAVDLDNDPNLYKKWILAQREYSNMMKKNLQLRALTCHADHLMQCSQKVDLFGNHKCECLQLPPYNLELDLQTVQCRAVDDSRCFSPFGFHCKTGSVCRQTKDDTCKCVRIPSGSKDLNESCSGYKQDYVAKKATQSEHEHRWGTSAVQNESEEAPTPRNNGYLWFNFL